MKAFFGGKTSIILFSLAAIALLIVLASGLEQVKFSAPMMVKIDNVYALNTPNGDEPDASTKWFSYIFLAAIIVMFLLFLGPIRPQTTSSLIKRLLLFSVAMFLFMIVMGRFANNSPFMTGEFDTTTASAETTTPQDQGFTLPPEARTSWVFWITVILVVVVCVVGVILLNRFLDKWWKPKELDGIAEIARSTLKELSAEKPSKNVIVRCYTRMTAAVNERRGLAREQSTTPSEFAAHLANVGLPREDLEGLTRIFERVRYGAQTVDADEVKEAKKYLSGILKACEANA